MIEEWKDIIGYEGLYQVSNLGRVKSLDRYIYWSRHTTPKFHCGVILKPHINERGYKYVLLVDKDGHNKNWRLHKLVAMAFVPNPDNLPQVNHKDENKLNNSADNLEWCTAEYNSNYGTRGQRISASRKLHNLLPEVCLEGGDARCPSN